MPTKEELRDQAKISYTALQSAETEYEQAKAGLESKLVALQNARRTYQKDRDAYLDVDLSEVK